jgi:hypothetical protein
MNTRTLLISTTAAAALAAAVAVPATAHKSAAAPLRVVDADADLRFDGRVLLEAETTGASRVTFTYRGKTFKAKRGTFDREDGTRDWYRTVRARGNDAAGDVTVSIRVRATNGGKSVTATQSEHLEREDDD